MAVGTTVTLTCTANGGIPRPGLELYRQPGDRLVRSVPQPTGQTVATLEHTLTLAKEDNQARYVCRTLVTSSRVGVTSSAEITFDIPCTYYIIHDERELRVQIRLRQNRPPSFIELL